MDTTMRQAETRHDTTEGDVMMTVADAAVAFGISEGAVRKRIERRQLAARKVSGQWRVILSATDATRHDATERDGSTRPNTTDTTRPTVSDGPRAQLDAVMSEWLAPLMKQIAKQAEQIGEQRERIARLEVERDAARAEATDLRDLLGAPQRHGEAESSPREANTAPEPLQRAQRRSWWSWLLRGPYEDDGMPRART